MSQNALSLLIASVQKSVAAASVKPLANALAKRTGIAASVVIATRDKATYLDLTLAALERQIFPSDTWEVVVADDGSRDDTLNILDKYESRKILRLVRLLLPGTGNLANARKKAVAAARGRVIVFLGDDCLTAPDFLTQHLRHHLKENCAVLGDWSRMVHTHLFCPNDLVLSGTSAQQVVTAEELASPEKLRFLVLHSGYDSRQDINNSVAWTCNNAINASVSQALTASPATHTDTPVHFEPRAFTLRQLSSQTPFLF
jgi:glycosyltransferase involved in cell wall biosynthesis